LLISCLSIPAQAKTTKFQFSSDGCPFSDQKCQFLKNEQFSDVRLVVVEQNADGSSKIHDAIPAHKVILASNSPVFSEMLANPIDPIQIENVISDTFDEILRFFYCDEIEIEGQKLLDLLDLALRFRVKNLVKQVTEKVRKTAEIQTLFQIRDKLFKYGQPEINEIAIDFVQTKGSEVFSLDLIQTFDRSMMKFLLEQPMLKVSDPYLLDLLVSWARKQAEIHSIVNPSPQELREIMGDFLYSIRIPSIDLKTLFQKSLEGKLFNSEEILEIVNYQALESKPKEGFVSKFNLKSPYSSKRFIKPIFIKGPKMSIQKTDHYDWFINSNAEFCIQQMNIISTLNSSISVSLLKKEGEEILLANGVPSLFEEDQLGFDFEPCIETDANVNLTLRFRFEETELLHYERKVERSFWSYDLLKIYSGVRDYVIDEIKIKIIKVFKD